MKTKLLVSLLLILVMGFKTDSTQSEIAPSDLLGTFLNQAKDANIRIFLAKNDKYSGKVEWMKEPNNEDGTPKLDVHNPDKSKRHRKRLGLVILRSFEFNAKDAKWEGGTVYDPKNGKTYNGYIRFANSDKEELLLRGYVMGIPMLGRTATWTRIK